MAAQTMEERLTSLGTKAQKARAKGQKWHEIAKDLGVSQGKVLLAFMYVEHESDRITYKNDADLAKKIVKARDAKQSWGLISARSGVPESRVRKIWEQETGKSAIGERIGKGGRHPGDGTVEKAAPAAKTAKTAKAATGAKAKAEAAKKTAAKKAPATKAAGTAKKATTKPPAGQSKLDLVLGGDTDTLAEVLEGKTIMVENAKSGKPETYKVKSVKSSTEDNVEIIDAKNGSTRTFKRTAIKRVSK